MKQTKRAMPGWLGLAAVVALALTVIGAGVVSNTMTITTHAAYAADLSQVNVNTEWFCGKDYPNLPGGEGNVAVGVTYDTGIRLTSSADLGSATVHFQIAKNNIAATDLTVSYGYNPTNAQGKGVWVPIVMTDEGNVLTGTFGPVNVPANYDVTMFLTVEYNVPGDYVSTCWLTVA